MNVRRSLWERMEPDLGPLEAEYRAAFLPEDRARGRLLLFAIAVLGVALLPGDLFLFRAQPQMLVVVLLLRVVLVVGCAGFAWRLSRLDPATGADALLRLMFCATIFVTCAQWVSASMLPATYFGPFIFDLLLVACCLLVVPLPLPHRLMSASLATCASLFDLFVVREPDFLYLLAVPTALAGVMVFGTVTSARFYTNRRALYRSLNEIRELNAQLTVLSEIDALTGVLNRRKLLELGGEEFTRFRRYAHPVSFAMLDVDLFKQVNDRFGHQTGDDVLRTVARVVQQAKRDTDKFGRLGGEEFGVLLPDTSRDAAVAVIERIRDTLAAEVIELDGTALTITFSAGVAELEPSDTGFDDALRRADELLYAAKRNGRNRVEGGATPRGRTAGEVTATLDHGRD